MKKMKWEKMKHLVQGYTAKWLKFTHSVVEYMHDINMKKRNA